MQNNRPINNMTERQRMEEVNTIKIGLLHSLTGTMACSELPLVDAEKLAIDEINAQGGVLGRKIIYVLEDGASDPDTFARKAETLITEHNVAVIFGGWNSHTRKSVKPIVEKYNSLFWYPLSYEGLEESENIFYTGSSINQQIIPAIYWCMEKGWRRYYLLGSDYIYPITSNKLINAVLMNQRGDVVKEEYLPLGHADFSGVIDDLKLMKPDVIVNTLNGDSNFHFFKQFHEAGFTADNLPIISTAIAEQECQQIGIPAKDHYACWTYFQTLDNPENEAFVRKFRQRYGQDRVVSDPIAMAYAQIFMWKQIVEGAGFFDADVVRKAAINQSFKTPAGEIRIRSNNHVTKKIYIGKANDKGQFDIVWETDDYVEPLPWLGIEKLDFPSIYLIKDVLSRFPDIVNFNAELERHVRERTNELHKKTVEYTNLIEGLSSDYLVYSHNLDGTFRYASPSSASILGIPADDVIGKNWRDVVDATEESVEAANRGDALAREGITHEGYEFEFRHANGVHRVLEIKDSPVFDKEGNAITISGIAKDITGRKKAEEAIRASEQNLSEAQRIAHIGSWSLDIQENILTWSDETYRIFGLTVGVPLTYEKFHEYVHPDDKEHVDQAWTAALQGAPYDIDHRILVDGEVKWVREKAELECDQDGLLLSGVGTIYDITERKKIEDALKQKDRDIRKAYADVFIAVTDEKLLILTPEEIAAATGKPQGEPYIISSFEKLAVSRDFLRSGLKKTSLTEDHLDSLIFASGEAVTNGIKHAGSCEVQVYTLNRTVQIRITDHGPGIDFSNLPKATLLPGFSTKNSLGVGYSIILNECDRVLLSTGPEGTTLLLESGGEKEKNTLDDILARGLLKEDVA